MEDLNRTYFALHSPTVETQVSSSFNPASYISEDKNTIIQLAKRYQNSRFKSFKDYEDALNFVVHGPTDTDMNSSTCAITEPPTCVFPSVDIPQLSCFKRLIETRDLSKVKNFVKDNPRFIISFSCDRPTILMAGPRYNAIHIAVRANAVDILIYLLETISSREYITKCYPYLDEESLSKRQNHLLDLFLNTPDKASFDTPMHFACRAGSIESIQVLLRYIPLCDINRKNKRDMLPLDLVTDEETKNEVARMFESCMYLTVLRKADGCDYKVNQPLLGEKSLDNSFDSKEEHISLVVGPMSTGCAEVIYESLRSPQKCDEELRKIRLNDHARGIEKVAKTICEQQKIPFREYWDFLGDFADFSTQSGLSKLDHHLQAQHSSCFSLLNCFGDLSIKSDDPDSSSDSFKTAPSFDDSNEMYLTGNKRQPIDWEVLEKIQKSIDMNLYSVQDLEAKYPYVHLWFDSFQEKQ